MRLSRSTILLVLMLLVLVANVVAPAAGSAATPAILLLAGKVTELEAKLSGGVFKVETAGAKTIVGTSVEVGVKGCSELESKTTDTNLCFDVPIQFTGVKKEKVACRSETTTAFKDSVETVLGLLDLHLDSETTAQFGGELEPLLVQSF